VRLQVIAIALYFFIIFCIEKAEALLKAAWNLIQAAFLVDRAGIEPAMFHKWLIYSQLPSPLGYLSILVTPTGVEPVIPALKGRCPNHSTMVPCGDSSGI
jgi:hypothetical protein